MAEIALGKPWADPSLSKAEREYAAKMHDVLVTLIRQWKRAVTAIWNGQRRGEGNPRAKITDAAVREVRRLRGKVRQRDLAEKYGVSKAVICAVQVRRRWAHVEDEVPQ